MNIGTSKYRLRSIRLLWKHLIGLLAVLYLKSCTPAYVPPQAAFYHWQTRFDLSAAESDYLAALHVQKLYLKCFDVDWQNGAPYPTAILQMESDLNAYELVPTIFITNRTLLEIEATQLPDLAQKIADKILQVFPKSRFQEVQFDCDWSGDTQQKYFELLRLLRQQFPKKTLSATIRLHQVKFFERTGVPPVDRGMLMCYNVGKIDDWISENSILDSDIVRQYLTNFEEYPLVLDVALPMFHWGLLFRDMELSRIFNNLRAEDLEDSTRFQAFTENRYEVIKDTYLNGHYLYEGDRIRLEYITQAELIRTARLLSEQLPFAARHISFYHLDTTTIQQHPHENLELILRYF